MYKLKYLYQDNPHISRRKGGKKSNNDKMGIKSRRISIPTSSSPKVSLSSFHMIINQRSFSLEKGK